MYRELSRRGQCMLSRQVLCRRKKPGEAQAEAATSQRKACKRSQCLFVNTLQRRAATHQSSLRMCCSTALPPNSLKANFPSFFNISTEERIHLKTIGLLIYHQIICERKKKNHKIIFLEIENTLSTTSICVLVTCVCYFTR